VEKFFASERKFNRNLGAQSKKLLHRR